jgi:hypothetical protein
LASWNAAMPVLMRSNHGIPLILTTVAITGFSCATSVPIDPTRATAATVVPASIFFENDFMFSSTRFPSLFHFGV